MCVGGGGGGGGDTGRVLSQPGPRAVVFVRTVPPGHCADKAPQHSPLAEHDQRLLTYKKKLDQLDCSLVILLSCYLV